MYVGCYKKETKRKMRPKMYMDELRIRWKYRQVGRRRSYTQRKRYEYGREEAFVQINIYSSDELSGEIVYQEEDRLLKGVSDRGRGFTRERGRSRRIRSSRGYRTRGPGRFRHESRKRRGCIIRTNRGRGRRRIDWYTSEVDVRRSDRIRNRGRYRLRIWTMWTYMKKDGLEKKRRGEKRRELRGRRLWLGRRIWVWISDERFDMSTRRSRGRSRISYIRRVERRRRGIYRSKGRKRK